MLQTKTTQWSSSDQARQVLCLTANGVIRHPQYRDVQPDAIVTRPNAGYGREPQTVWIPRCPVDPMRDLQVLDTLVACGYAIIDTEISKGGTMVRYWS